MSLPKVPYRRTGETPTSTTTVKPAPIQLEGQIIDSDKELPVGWHQNPHPQILRPHQRSYAPYGQPPHLDQIPLNQAYGPDGQPIDPAQYYAAHGYYPPAPATNVEVNNNGQFFRPLKEELTLSFARSIGNFFAWPFRLVGRFIEGAIMAGLGVLKLVSVAIVMPLVLFTGYQYYESNQDKPGTEVAAELGKDGVGLVGAMLGGVWDGIFGSDDPETSAPAPVQQKEAPAAQ